MREDGRLSNEGSATLANAELVNQTFINSHINIIGGYQHNANITVRGQFDPNQGARCEKLIKICNEHTEDMTGKSTLDDFRNEELQEPSFYVYPQMRSVGANKYYKGFLGKNVQHQLTNEVGFRRQDASEAEAIKIDDIISSLRSNEKTPSKAVGVTAIVASAGSGKTTLTCRIARQLLGIYFTDEVKDTPFHGPKMVLYIELKDVIEVTCTTLSKFLFGGLYKNNDEEDQVFEWLDEHQSDVVIIFDGLDQAKWDFHQESLRQIKKYDVASTSTVMFNILTRNLLRHVKILVSSREFMVSELPAMARPETIITLNGLALEDAYKLFTFLLGENGEGIWKNIETMSPRLLNLVSVPVFLILTAVVMGRDPSKPPPATVTKLYARIILALECVENIRNRKEILSIINKLKAMAFQGMKEGRVVFKETDLSQFQLSALEVQDLMTKVPGKNLLSRHLMQGDFDFFFCHQSIQEFLAASFIAEMEFDDFCRFDEKHLHEDRWFVVRRFVMGVVYSESANDVHRVSDQSRKKQVLFKSIGSQLEEKIAEEENYNRMELYTAIYESNNEDLMKSPSLINASRISLSRDQAHIIGSLAVRNASLHSLNLKDCNINDELLGIIARCVTDRIHVTKVNLFGNYCSATALRTFLGQVRTGSPSGKLDWKVVRMEVEGDGFGVELRKKEGIIKIRGHNVEGHFNIKDSKLVFERCALLATAAYLGIFFEARSINSPEHLYAKQNDLPELSKWKLEMISKILLDCTEEENIDWSLIENLKKYQVEFLDIAINGHIYADDCNRTLKRWRNITGFGIHAMFYVRTMEQFKNTIEASQQNKIEYIRCLFKWIYNASLDEISTLVNNSNSKKVTLRYDLEDDLWNGDELKKSQAFANDLHAKLEVLWMTRIENAWELLDYRFCFRERKRRCTKPT